MAAIVIGLLAVGVIAYNFGASERPRFMANCRAAGFADQQCAFLYAMERRRAAADDDDITAPAVHSVVH